MNDHTYIFGKKKDGAKENIMTKEQLEAIRKKICKDYNITYDENTTVPTLNGKPIKEGDIVKACIGILEDLDIPYENAPGKFIIGEDMFKGE